MARERFRLQQTIDLIREHGPISPNALTELTGDWRSCIDHYIRLAHEAGLIHIAAFGPSPFGGNRTVKLWAYGPGEDAKRPKVPQKRYPKRHKGTPKSREALQAIERRSAAVAARRDPMIEALFGSPA